MFSFKNVFKKSNLNFQRERERVKSDQGKLNNLGFTLKLSF